MDFLGAEQFHVLGFSMGGMIAQILAGEHPSRVLSLVSLMSSGGEAEILSTPDATDKMNQSARRFAPEKAVDLAVSGCEVYAGRQAIISQEAARRWAEASVNRSYCPEDLPSGACNTGYGVTAAFTDICSGAFTHCSRA